MRKLNVRWLAGLILGAITLSGLAFLLHEFQMSRNASVFKREALRAQSEDRPRDAVTHLRRYVKLAPNDTEGRFNVKVTSSSGSLTASTVVAQVNIKQAAAAKKSSNKVLWILLAVGGAGAAGIVAATSGKGSSSPGAAGPVAPPPSITIVPGPVTVGGPK